jgi:hypothetical protein
VPTSLVTQNRGFTTYNEVNPRFCEKAALGEPNAPGNAARAGETIHVAPT